MAKRRVLAPIPNVPAVRQAQDMVEPHLAHLDEREKTFVRLVVQGKGSNLPQAAEQAGYQNPMEPMSSRRILRAIVEHADLRIQAAGYMAAEALIEIAQQADHKDRFGAVKEVLNRAGLTVEDRKRIIIEDTRTPEQIAASVTALAVQLGIDPQKLLGQQVKVIEGDFEEVEGDGS